MVNMTNKTTTNFDQPINRQATGALKWDDRLRVFGYEEVLPLWVADMDFAVPSVVTDALQQRVQHPIYGYQTEPEGLYSAVLQWMYHQHQWQLERNWVSISPGVVPILYAAVQALTRAGEGVIVQPPVYAPFFNAIKEQGRRVIENPLKLLNGRYEIDFEHLESCAQQAKLMLFCSPHNPVGRVWTKEELTHLLSIAEKYQLTIISDEIHADLILPGHRHIPLASLQGASQFVATAVAPSKTFNIPALGLAFLIAANAELHQRLVAPFKGLHIDTKNPLSIVAAQAAYQQAKPWLDELLIYLDTTRQQVIEYCQQHLPHIIPVHSQATYLMWLDCRQLGLNDAALQRLFVEQAGVGLSVGKQYGTGGSGFMRLNIAAPRSLVMQALEQIKQAVQQIV